MGTKNLKHSSWVIDVQLSNSSRIPRAFSSPIEKVGRGIKTSQQCTQVAVIIQTEQVEAPVVIDEGGVVTPKGDLQDVALVWIWHSARAAM